MQNARLQVSTSAGPVRGIESDGLLIWRGVPFAAPPVGDLRHRPPAPPEPWSGVRETVEVPAIAWQSPPPAAMPAPLGIPAPPPPDEDCLYLSITRPDVPLPTAGLPVLVWIHGGGYVSGSSALDTDGVALARHGLVVVSAAYRLGAFGFLHLGELLGEPFAGSGAVGFADQLHALRWVRNNISAFGGDPRRVTVYGISAGAKSVANILSHPGSRGLVHRAVSASGGGEHVATVEQAGQVTTRFLAALGLRADTVDRVTSVPAAELVGAQERISSFERGLWLWRPVVDGSILADIPIGAIERGAAAGVPLLVGNNGREAATFALFDPSAAAPAQRVLRELFGPEEAKAIRGAYADEPDDSAVDVAVMSDERYGAPTRRLAEVQSRYADVWRYRFDATAPGVTLRLSGGHGMDQAAVWSAHRWEGRTDPRSLLCRAFNTAIGAFAGGRDPSAPLLPDWPRYAAEKRETMILDLQPRVESDPRSARRQAWQGRTWASGTWWDIDDLAPAGA
jgi:para-nitrobenzyl esterase